MATAGNGNSREWQQHLKVGILGIQGDIRRHREALQQLQVSPIAVRSQTELEQTDCLIIPGGESTTISKLLDFNNLSVPLSERIAGGMPTWGTCAGMILLASLLLDGRADQNVLGSIDIVVRRNAYGRQIASFEAFIDIPAIGPDPFCGVFIRSPRVEKVGSEVEVLASYDDSPVLCRQEHVWVSSFHPELTGDTRLHKLFLKEAATCLGIPNGQP